jgi:peptide/nickel transport system substrate-binding protein
MVIYNLGETLYTYELGTTRLKPQLAAAMPQVSEDVLTYTIPLRRGVTFHDGTPFNAEAMAFSLKRFMENGGKPSFLLADTIASVKATGEYEIQIVLKQPFSALPALLAFPGACAVSPKAYEIGKDKFKPDSFVGTGPYRLVEFDTDSLRLEAFANYWGEKPKNQGIDLQIYPNNPANLFNAFQTQAVDVAYQSLLPQQVKRLKASKDKWQVIENPGTSISFLALNLKSDPLNQRAVRQAIASLINRQLLNERVLQGQGEPLYSLIPTAFADYKPVFKEAYGDGNAERAKQLLASAGYSAQNPAVVEVWYSSGATSPSLVAAILKALAERDLDGAVQFQPNSVLSAAFFKNVSGGIYPASLSGWYPDFLDADNYIYPFLDCAKGTAATGCQEGGSQSQGSFYYSDRMNQLIDRQRQERDPAVRQQIFAEIQEILAQDVPYIPLWQSKDYAFAQNGISGVTINPSQYFPFWTIGK